MTDPELECPYCGAQSTDITCSEDTIQHFLCFGSDAHEWTRVIADFEAGDEPLIILP